MNRLEHEKSPYLLQHAGNPVDWYPWGDEAFLKAAKEDKPVFLSVGYSTCHWCHVMAEESFESTEVAEILNRGFVCIKVDREERPDIDSAYMRAVAAMGGSGGWPLNVFLTPGRRPFYGGTYFPPEQLKTLLRTVAEAWKDKRGEIDFSAAQLAEGLAAGGEKTEGAVTEELFGRAYRELERHYDPVYGGLGTAPKFPTGHSLSFLLLHYYRTGEKKALELAENTLWHIAEGGIFDHLGGGFHRYSTDREWFLPHFEKMLYDQAVLADAYLEAYQLTKKELYADVARRVFDYVLRDLSRPGGGFYCAEDADSAPDPARPGEKTEGAYYVWTSGELKDVLGTAQAEVFAWRYGVKEEGNVAADPRLEFGKKNVLSAAKTLSDTAARFKKPESRIEAMLGLSREKLLKARSRRARPHLDDKVLTDWNGLMISTLARGAGILREPRYMAAAAKAAGLVLSRLRTDDGRLLHRFREGEAGIPGFLDDYAFFTRGLLDLYEATFEADYLERAAELCAKMLELFEDDRDGGLFFTAAGSEKILAARAKEYYDGAVPSGNSAAAQCLVRLAHLTRRKDFAAAYEASLGYVSGRLARSPSAFTQLLLAVDAALRPGKQVVIAAAPGKDQFVSGAAALARGLYLPDRLLLLRTPQKNDRAAALAPWIKGFEAAGGKTTVYVCADRVCLPPVTDLPGLAAALGTREPGAAAR